MSEEGGHNRREGQRDILVDGAGGEGGGDQVGGAAVGYMYLEGAVEMDVDIDTKWPNTWWRTLWVVGLKT